MSSPIPTTVSRLGPHQFTAWGKSLGHTLHDTEEQISQGLAGRLVRYALQRAAETGMDSVFCDWTASVYTMNGDERPSKRYYNVVFANGKGFGIELCQILTRSGHPFIDHGWEIAG
jgi:hypothetical protein